MNALIWLIAPFVKALFTSLERHCYVFRKTLKRFWKGVIMPLFGLHCLIKKLSCALWYSRNIDNDNSISEIENIYLFIIILISFRKGSLFFDCLKLKPIVALSMLRVYSCWLTFVFALRGLDRCIMEVHLGRAYVVRRFLHLKFLLNNFFRYIMIFKEILKQLFYILNVLTIVSQPEDDIICFLTSFKL